MLTHYWRIRRGVRVRGSSTESNSQTPTAGSTPIPQLGPGNIEAVREAVIAKVQPAVVQITMSKQGKVGDLVQE